MKKNEKRKIPETVDVAWLWNKNKNRKWINVLLERYQTSQGKDYETIAFWLNQFRNKTETSLVVDCTFIIIDGHHRLIAAKLAGLLEIQVRVCPQKTTYR